MAPLDPIFVHESGHAFVAHHFGGEVVRCEVFGADGGGVTRFRGLSRRAALRFAVAGHVAVKLAFGAAAADPEMSAKDVELACGIALGIVRMGEAKRLAARGLDEPTEAMLARYGERAAKLIEFAEADVAEILAANVATLRLLAEHLQEHGELDDATVKGIVAGAA